MKSKPSVTRVFFVLSALFAVKGTFARTSLLDNTASGQLRGARTTLGPFNRRRLPKRPSGHSHSTSHSGYLGCLGLSDSELQSSWKLSGKAPKCQYKHHAGKGNTTSSGSSSTEDNGNADGGNSGTDNEAATDGDHVVNNGDFENVNDNGDNSGSGSSNQNGNGANNGNSGGNANNGQNEGNGNNGGNGNNANNGGNGGNANNDEDEKNGGNGENSNNGGNGNNVNNGENEGNNDGQDGKNSGNSNGQNQGQNNFDPYGDFDIAKCDTYENLWLWDLSLTCEKEGDPSTCECIFAEEMMELGSLSCEDAVACPRNCRICSRCMKLLGCQVPKSSTSFLGSGRNVTMLVVALGFLVCAGAYYTRRRRRRGPSILQKVLLDDNSSASDGSSEGGWVWLAPVASTHDPEDNSIYTYNNAAQLPIWIPKQRHGKDQKPIWLAPDASSQQLASNETPVWLAPDATSVELATDCTEDKQVWLSPDASSEQLGKNSDKKDSSEAIPDTSSKELENQSVNPAENELPDSLAFEPLSTTKLYEPKVEYSQECNEEVSLGAWSVEAEDPSISGIQFTPSNPSPKGSHTSEMKQNQTSPAAVAPETISEESDDDLPDFT